MAFQLQPFSRKQLQALHWWRPGSGHEHCRILLADGLENFGQRAAVGFRHQASSFACVVPI